MDGGPLALFMVGLFVFLIVFILLLGRYHPKSGAEILDWRPTRSPQLEAENEVDDVAQMVAGINERRRRRGEAEITEESITKRVRADEAELAARRDRGSLELELEQVLEARNARRRKRGLPDMTLDELRTSLGEPRR